ncbi:MAG: C40 family peptidase [Cyanobacteria bacterium P01_G01_bin.38]
MKGLIAMVLMESLKAALIDFPGREYRCDRTLNLYKTPAAEGLVTQAAPGRQLRILEITRDAAQVCLCEDDYPGWLLTPDLAALSPAQQSYRATPLSATDIQAQLPQVIRFTQTALAAPNEYLWGGTVAPNYDCSGLVQAAFRSVGIQLPRDAYQQASFAQKINRTDLQPGDLIFFGNETKITHVALYLGNSQYIHSSGKDQGRNGIGIDSITDLSHPVSQTYHAQIKSYGRITRSYSPQAKPILAQ